MNRSQISFHNEVPGSKLAQMDLIKKLSLAIMKYGISLFYSDLLKKIL